MLDVLKYDLCQPIIFVLMSHTNREKERRRRKNGLELSDFILLNYVFEFYISSQIIFNLATPDFGWFPNLEFARKSFFIYMIRSIPTIPIIEQEQKLPRQVTQYQIKNVLLKIHTQKEQFTSNHRPTFETRNKLFAEEQVYRLDALKQTIVY